MAVADHPIMNVRRPSGFIAPCLPSKAGRPPSGPLWVHEIKHDGYRLMVRRDGGRVRCFTRNGHDWADLFPAIVDAALRIKATSFLIDGEAVITRDDERPDFRALDAGAMRRCCRPFWLGLEGIVSKPCTDLTSFLRRRLWSLPGIRSPKPTVLLDSRTILWFAR